MYGILYILAKAKRPNWIFPCPTAAMARVHDDQGITFSQTTILQHLNKNSLRVVGPLYRIFELQTHILCSNVDGKSLSCLLRKLGRFGIMTPLAFTAHSYSQRVRRTSTLRCCASRGIVISSGMVTRSFKQDKEAAT